MFPHPYRIPAVVTALAAALAIAAAAFHGDTLALQCTAVAFAAAAVCVALGPRTALRWSLTAALALFAVAQLLTIRGYADPAVPTASTNPAEPWQQSLTLCRNDALALMPALAALIVALFLVPRPRDRTVPAAIVAAVPVLLALTDVVTDLDRLSWTAPMLIGTWAVLVALLAAAAVLFLTIQRASSSLWPAAGAVTLTVLGAHAFTNAADIWSMARRLDDPSAFVELGVAYQTSGPEVSVLSAVLIAVTLAAPILLAWSLLRLPGRPANG